MRTLSALLMVLLLCSLQQVCSGTERGTNIPQKCCSRFIKVRIPLRFIISFSKNNSNCPKEAVIFYTVAGKEWCADPKASWVKDSIMKLNS
ncbi:monocyte chemotactic protein 1B-like isoform X1 [Colossoma macropomum]|uniref:monocyte chemotactic protein 1B-like isoform X1 n=1 Tax=Colossoma macropomum TaxID=42526 RepID=UPI001863B318|nr:monocyte chemotactic protein 1B-like isoform X1 [Colossoma macropomum]